MPFSDIPPTEYILRGLRDNRYDAHAPFACVAVGKSGDIGEAGEHSKNCTEEKNPMCLFN